MMVVKDAENVLGPREYFVGQTLGRGMYTHTMYSAGSAGHNIQAVGFVG